MSPEELDKLSLRLRQVQVSTLIARHREMSNEELKQILGLIFHDLQEIILEIDPVNAMRGEE
jgi:hypothetical protein